MGHPIIYPLPTPLVLSYNALSYNVLDLPNGKPFSLYLPTGRLATALSTLDVSQ